MREIVFEDKKHFAAFYLDLFQLLNVPRVSHAKGRMREFLICSMVLYNEGWDLNSPDAVDEISARMQFSSKDEVYNYRIRLKKVGLLQQDSKKGCVLPPALRLDKIRSSITFSFKTVNKFE